MIDPPAGWRYGFPKVLPDGVKIATFLMESGYPEDEIDFAVRWMRMWEVDEGNEQAGPQGEAQGEATQPYRQGSPYSQVPAADRA